MAGIDGDISPIRLKKQNKKSKLDCWNKDSPITTIKVDIAFNIIDGLFFAVMASVWVYFGICFIVAAVSSLWCWYNHWYLTSGKPLHAKKTLMLRYRLFRVARLVLMASESILLITYFVYMYLASKHIETNDTLRNILYKGKTSGFVTIAISMLFALHCWRSMKQFKADNIDVLVTGEQFY